MKVFSGCRVPASEVKLDYFLKEEVVGDPLSFFTHRAMVKQLGHSQMLLCILLNAIPFGLGVFEEPRVALILRIAENRMSEQLPASESVNTPGILSKKVSRGIFVPDFHLVFFTANFAHHACVEVRCYFSDIFLLGKCKLKGPFNHYVQVCWRCEIKSGHFIQQ